MAKRIQIKQGDRFGLLTVVEEAEPYVVPHTGKTKRQVRCVCDCGAVRVVGLRHLRSGATTACRSCGMKTHGQSRRSGAYQSWDGMIQRCHNANHQNYQHYGGRGISVCHKWRRSFEAFYEDMGDRPFGCTIERINTNGNYEPGNCRWATQKEQLRNTRRTHWLEYRGETKSLGEWAEQFGVPYGTLWSRVQTLGFSAEEALHGKAS